MADRLTKADLRRLVWYRPDSAISFAELYGHLTRWERMRLIEPIGGNAATHYKLTSTGNAVRSFAAGKGVRAAASAPVSDHCIEHARAIHKKWSSKP